MIKYTDTISRGLLPGEFNNYNAVHPAVMTSSLGRTSYYDIITNIITSWILFSDVGIASNISCFFFHLFSPRQTKPMQVTRCVVYNNKRMSRYIRIGVRVYNIRIYSVHNIYAFRIRQKSYYFQTEQNDILYTAQSYYLLYTLSFCVHPSVLIHFWCDYSTATGTGYSRVAAADDNDGRGPIIRCRRREDGNTRGINGGGAAVQERVAPGVPRCGKT